MTRRASDDLFEDTRMSFGEHLEELRKTLVRSLIFIGLGCVIGFLVAEEVVNFLQGPLVRAIKEYNDSAALQKYTDDLGWYPPEIETRLSEGFAPQTGYVDPGQLIQAIQSVSPGALADVDLTPYRFAADAIEPMQAATIADELIQHDRSENEERNRQLKSVYELLDDQQRQNLVSIASPADGTDAALEASRDQLVEILNEVIDQPQLHQDEAFSPMMTDVPWAFSHLLNPVRENQLKLMKVKVDEAPEDADLSRRLNRLLVARLFPDEVAKPTINLFRIDIWQDVSEGTQALSPHEVFMVWIKAAIVTGLILSGPFVFHQIWLFVAAGLYPHEQKYVYYYLPISIVLFMFGVCLAFFFVFDPVLKFLFSFNASMGISPQLRIGEWLSFVMFLPLGFGIAFQLPLVMLFTNRIGLASIELYKSNWRLAVMIISVLSMLLTPADPISMIMLGAPLTFLYFFGIGLCKWMPKPENPFGEDAVSGASTA